MKIKPKNRGMYAIKSGDRQGGFIVFIKKYFTKMEYACLFMPDPMEAIYLSKDEANSMIQTRKLDFVKKLPVQIYEICQANYEHYKL